MTKAGMVTMAIGDLSGAAEVQDEEPAEKYLDRKVNDVVVMVSAYL